MAQQQQKPSVASVLFNPFSVGKMDLNRSQPSIDDLDEESEQDRENICYIRTKRSNLAKRAMFDNE